MTQAAAVLSEHFSTVLAGTVQTGAMGEVLALLSKGILNRADFLEIIERHELDREPWFPGQRLDLVLDYLGALIVNGRLDEEELDAIDRLKSCLGVEEGDFVSLRPAEVAAVLTSQLEGMLEDDSIDEGEDLRQAELQAAFDLSYDQYLQLTRLEFERTMSSLTERLSRLRSTGDQGPMRILEAKIAALDPIYRLAVSQYRPLGALY